MAQVDSPKILWVLCKWTLPANDGARVATERLIVNTIKAGAQVDVLCLGQPHEQVDECAMKAKWNVGEVKVLRRPLPEGWPKKIFFYLRSLLKSPSTPLTFSSFTDKKLKRQVDEYLLDKQYAFMVLDGLHQGAPWVANGNFLKPMQVDKVVYRAHNLEQDLWIRAYQKKTFLPFKLFLKWQAALVAKIEHSIIAASQGVAPIAAEDLQSISALIPEAVQRHIPLGLDFSSPLPPSQMQKINLLFIGRLDWPPNRDGLKWLLEYIWPEVSKRRSDLTLNIVGSGDSAWMKSYASLPGINFIGFVQNIEDAYRQCHFTVVPITYGSGTRIKVLESFSMGRALISTSMGVQGAGLDSDDYILAETTQDWIHVLSNLTLEQAHSQSLQRAQLKLAHSYDQKKVGEDFYAWVNSL